MNARSLMLLTLTLFTAPYSVSDAANNQARTNYENSDYYSDDLDTAIEAAKEHEQSQLIGKEWHHKTTSQSFPLPKMLNTEMERLSIEGAISATAAGAQQINITEESNDDSVRENALGHNLEEEELIETTPQPEVDPTPVVREIDLYFEEASTRTVNGTLIIRDARATGTVTSTNR